jgi:hypothetical protein
LSCGLIRRLLNLAYRLSRRVASPPAS